MARIAITGSTGLIGEALVSSLKADGDTVQRIVRHRSAASSGDVVWDLEARSIDAANLEGVDAVVHLAGEPIGASRWTTAQKRRIRESRVVGTELIADTVARLDDGPRVLVSASAVGFYGDRGAETITESTPPGDDYLARMCADWEAAAAPAARAGIRVVHPRTGVIIAAGGPLIEKIRLPFRLGVGGKVGNGRQYVPWISLDDHVRAVRFLIDHELEGPVNSTAPTPVTNFEMTKALGQVMRRPTIFRIPALAVRLVYGEVGDTLATVSQRVVPQRLLQAGFSFRHTLLGAALEAALGEAEVA